MFVSAHAVPQPSEQTAQPPIRVLVVDDAAFYREVVVSCLNEEPDIEVAGEAADGWAALAEARRLRPDVVLMDINLPGMSGVEATRQILTELPNLWVIGLSMHNEADMARPMREAGACDYVSKGGDAQSLLRAIRAAGEGTRDR